MGHSSKEHAWTKEIDDCGSMVDETSCYEYPMEWVECRKGDAFFSSWLVEEKDTGIG